jgi:hypothetical protein
VKNIVPGSPEEKMERRAERGIDMETWGFYVSGVRYGTCRKEGERVFHSPLDVTSGEFLPERELAPEDDRYVVLGKMNVREALLHLEPCQEGIRLGRQVYGFLRGDL